MLSKQHQETKQIQASLLSNKVKKFAKPEQKCSGFFLIKI